MASTPARYRRSVAFARWWRSAQWYVVALGAGGAFVLGVVGFSQRFALIGESRSIADAAYLAMQLFTLESGSAQPPVPLALDIARFLAPAVAALGAITAALSLLGERVSRLRVRSFRDHVVVCGCGERGERIASEFLGAGHRVVVIECDEQNPRLAQVRSAGAVVLIGDATDPHVLGQARAERARYLIATCADDGANATTVAQVIALRASCRSIRPMTAIVHARSAELGELLAAASALSCGDSAMRIEFFSVPGVGAAAMLGALAPISRDPTRPPRIAVVGLDALGSTLVMQLARSWWLSRDTLHGRPEFVLVDPHAEVRVEILRARAPRLADACTVRTVEADVGDAVFESGTFLLGADGAVAVDAVYVCCDDDAQALTAALALRRVTRAARVPIAMRMLTRAGLSALAESHVGDFADLHVVGVLDAACSLATLLGGVNESVARAVHADYVRREREAGRTVADNPSMAAWDDLPEHLRESNRRQADDIGVKLDAVGMAIVPLSDWAAESDALTPDELERLAIDEHDRWVRERLDQGWRFAPGRKDVERKTSPYLVGWDDLTEEIRDLDRDAVRAIPALLAGAGLTMRRISVD